MIAREDASGTDAMLAGLTDPARRAPEAGDPLSWAFDASGELLQLAADWLSGVPAAHGPRAGGILYKAPKPGQERRTDLPTIGPTTVLRAAEAGLAGLVIESGGVLVLDLPRVVALLDAADMFLWVRPA